MKSKICTFLLAICLFFIGARVDVKATLVNEDPITLNPENDYDGTWQIQVVNSRDQPYIPGNIEEIVRENRKQSETVYIKLDDYIRIKILSQDEISSASFKPLEKVVHIEE